jgi:hypothetical protein
VHEVIAEGNDTVAELKAKLPDATADPIITPLALQRLMFEEQLLGVESKRLSELSIADGARLQVVTLYDAVVKVDQFLDVYDPTKGWYVSTPAGDGQLSKLATIVKVAPIGHFNAGKTFITSKLSGRTLPFGYRTHTEGLSILMTENTPGDTDNYIAWMDTAGLDSPVVQLGQGVDADPNTLADSAALVHNPELAEQHGRQLVDTLEKELGEVKRIEDFHRAVAYEFADVYLFVINEMSHQDQLEILLLLQAIQRTKVQKSVYVVHNLQRWSLAELNEKGADNFSYVERLEALFFTKSTKKEVKATVDARWNLAIPNAGATTQGLTTVITTVPVLFGAFADPETRHPVEMLHVFLVNDNRDVAEKTHNACSLAHLRQAITQKIAPRSTVLGTVSRIMTKVQHSFAVIPSIKPPELGFKKVSDTERRVFHMPKDASGKVTDPAKVEVKPLSMVLPSFLTLGSDHLQYNVVQLEGRVAQVVTAKGTGMVARTMYGVQIVVPGLRASDLPELTAKLGKWNATGTRMETLDRKKTLHLDFQAKERLAPDHIVAKIVAQLPPGIVSVCEFEPKVIHEGTRPPLDPVSNSRSLTAQMRTGLQNVTIMMRPLVAYSDGILSIVVTSNVAPRPQPSPGV